MADGLEELKQVKHIVVLMMENRSFDHMLGYLTLEGRHDIDGLTGDEHNLDPNGEKVPIHAFDASANRVQRPGEALQKKLDPDHSPDGVAKQLGKGPGDFLNGGFVEAFVESRKPEDNVGPDLWNVPMGYYTKKDLPVYDYFADEYCVCDAWHASIPGDTWPNRLYSLAGRAADNVIPDLPWPLERLEHLPIFDVRAFTHHLDDHQWRWYSHDPGTLRAADGKYRDPLHLHRDNFCYFDRKKVGAFTQLAESPIVAHDSFLDDAAKGQLRDVSWIDPNFVDLSILDPNSNDDHPPSDIRAGQAFILDVYEALRRSPQWEDTVLVVVYDEHGGFYDHVVPPAVDDAPPFKTLGVRVPALVVGPRVKKRFVCKETLDHTTLIKTILTRFAPAPDEAIASMGPRVAGARHLGSVLEGGARSKLGDHSDARENIDHWRATARDKRLPRDGPSVAPDGAGQPFRLHEFQQDFLNFATLMRQRVLPPGQP